MDHGTPPAVPPEFQIYNSYEEDPKWQRKFSIIWASLLGLVILASVPNLYHALRDGRLFIGLFGIRESLEQKDYTPLSHTNHQNTPGKRRISAFLRTAGSFLLWSPPGIELNAGQVIVVLAYLVIVLVCIIVNAPLMDNPNRAGFLALAQFPVVFLFATKNSIVSLLLGPGNGYEKLNYVHRWSARCMFLGGVVHGSLWIRNHLEWNIPIIGQQKETSGVTALGLLCVIVLTSLKPVRRLFYEVFFVIHVLAFVAFFITVCYHTIYASPWIFPPLAFYGLDMMMRLLRYRIKDATLIPVSEFMTLVHIPDCDAGWEAGQHVRLRVFFSGRVFESHPLTIANAPPPVSCLESRGIVLGARVNGDWTRALNAYARAEKQSLIESLLANLKAGTSLTETPIVEVPVQVMLDGPYGGCSLDLGRYESVLLFAGGSGATFTIGLLDDIVGRCVKLGRSRGERTRRIEFAWCIRSFGCIEWFAPMLKEIAIKAANSSVDLHISIFVTCLCDPESVPLIPNSVVTIARPSVHDLLKKLVTPSAETDASSTVSDVNAEEKGSANSLSWSGCRGGGGVAVCASGPERLTREAANAVARIGLIDGLRVGGIALHTELFSM